MKDVILEHAQKAIEQQTFPGGVVGWVRSNGEREIVPFGCFMYEHSPMVREDTIYDTASLTKVIPTGALALMLLDKGEIKLEDRLIDYVSEFNNSHREEVMIKHLLTYSLDGYGLASQKGKSAREYFDFIMTKDFEKAPGTVFKYTNIPAFLMGLVVEKVMGDSLDKLAQKHIFEPLGMTRSTFNPKEFDGDEVAPTEEDDRGPIHREVHDESAWTFMKDNTVVGHAGLFSCAPDLLTFMEMLLKGGEYNGTKFFSQEIIKEMHTNQLADIDECNGLGWELNQPRYMSDNCTEHTFGKTGFTGTLLVADHSKDIAYVILTNRVHPKRPEDSAAINVFRKAVGELLLA